MAHLIESDDTLALACKPAWHGLGTVFPEPIAARDILPAAGIDWLVDLAPVYVLHNGQYVEALDRRATVRADTSKVLGIVSDSYRIVQNRELVAVTEELMQAADLVVESAGSMRGNRRVFILFRMPGSITVGGIAGEDVATYLLATTGHDGQDAFSLKFTSVRVVCNNTWTAAQRGKGNSYTFAHLGDTSYRLQQIREALQIGYRYQESAHAFADALATQVMSADAADAFLRSLIPTSHATTAERQAETDGRVERARQAISNVHATRDDLAPIRDTAYGWLQATSAYEQHQRRYLTFRGVSATERRFERMTDDANLTARAANILSRAGFTG